MAKLVITIHIYDWLGKKFDDFTTQESELQEWEVTKLRKCLFYGGPLLYQYEFLWVELLVNLEEWFWRLVEAPKYRNKLSKNYSVDYKGYDLIESIRLTPDESYLYFGKNYFASLYYRVCIKKTRKCWKLKKKSWEEQGEYCWNKFLCGSRLGWLNSNFFH